MARRGDDRSSYERDQDRKLAKERFAAKTAADLAEARYLDQKGGAMAQQAGMKQLAGQPQGTGIAASEASQTMMKDPRFVNAYANAETDFKSKYGNDPLKYFGTIEQYQDYLTKTGLKGLAGDVEKERQIQVNRDEVANADKFNEQFRNAPPQQVEVTRFDSVGGRQIPIKSYQEFGGDLYKAGIQDKANELGLKQSKVGVDLEKIASGSDWRKYDSEEQAKAAIAIAQEKAMGAFADKFMVANPNATPEEIGQAWNKIRTAGNAKIKPPTGIDDTTPPPGAMAPRVQPQRFSINPDGSSAPIGQSVTPPPAQTGIVPPATPQARPLASRLQNAQKPEWLSEPIVPAMFNSLRRNIEERRNRAR